MAGQDKQVLEIKARSGTQMVGYSQTIAVAGRKFTLSLEVVPVISGFLNISSRLGTSLGPWGVYLLSLTVGITKVQRCLGKGRVLQLLTDISL